MNLQELANQVRGTSLWELLRWHGFEIKQEGVSFRARSDSHSIVVTGSKWFDNKVGVGGAGAIDLQIHLCGGDFQTTCHVLAEEFRPTGRDSFLRSRTRRTTAGPLKNWPRNMRFPAPATGR